MRVCVCRVCVDSTEPMQCCVLCPAWGNSITHGSQSRSGRGGQMSSEEWSDGGRTSTSEIIVIK